VLRPPLQHPPVIRHCQHATSQARLALREYWASYASGFRDTLRSYGPAAVAPRLLGGHRHADLIRGQVPSPKLRWGGR